MRQTNLNNTQCSDFHFATGHWSKFYWNGWSLISKGMSNSIMLLCTAFGPAEDYLLRSISPTRYFDPFCLYLSVSLVKLPSRLGDPYLLTYSKDKILHQLTVVWDCAIEGHYKRRSLWRCKFPGFLQNENSRRLQQSSIPAKRFALIINRYNLWCHAAFGCQCKMGRSTPAPQTSHG